MLHIGPHGVLNRTLMFNIDPGFKMLQIIKQCSRPGYNDDQACSSTVLCAANSQDNDCLIINVK